MQIKYDYKEYEKVLRDDIHNHQLMHPKFIPMVYEEPIYVLVDDIVYTPTLKLIDDFELPKAVKELYKKSDFVIFSMDRILGNDKFMLTEFDFQPREQCHAWVIADKIDGKLMWFKEFGSTADIQDFIASYTIIRIDSISNDKDVSQLGKDIYKQLYKENLRFSFWKGESFDILMELNAADWNSPFYSYNIRKLLGEGI